MGTVNEPTGPRETPCLAPQHCCRPCLRLCVHLPVTSGIPTTGVKCMQFLLSETQTLPVESDNPSGFIMHNQGRTNCRDCNAEKGPGQKLTEFDIYTHVCLETYIHIYILTYTQMSLCKRIIKLTLKMHSSIQEMQTNAVWFHLYEILRIVKFTEAEGPTHRFQGLRGGEGEWGLSI